MGAVFTILSAGLGAIGSIAQGNAQAQAMQAQASNAQMQAQIAEQNAKLARDASFESLEEGAREERKFRRRANQFAAGQLTQLAASGVQLSGSALNVLADTGQGIEEDARQIKYNALKNMWGNLVDESNYLSQANSQRAAAQSYMSQAKSAKRAGMFGALGSVIGGAASLYATNHSTYTNGGIKVGNGMGGADTFANAYGYNNGSVLNSGGYYQSVNKIQTGIGPQYGMGNPGKSFVW